MYFRDLYPKFNEHASTEARVKQVLRVLSPPVVFFAGTAMAAAGFAAIYWPLGLIVAGGILAWDAYHAPPPVSP